MNWSAPENWHYSANVFPLMASDELEALTQDIKTNGLLNPLIRCAGKILDGRNRAIACFAAEVEPKFRDISEAQATVWARSQNIFRRSLCPNQQAFAYVVLSEISEVPIGKDRVRAYRKLKELKESLLPLVEKAKNGESVFEELENLLKPKKKESEKNIFVVLQNRLHVFEPSWSDGSEHTFILQIEEAINTKVNDDIEKFKKKSLRLTLERLSKNFSSYAEKLK